MALFSAYVCNVCVQCAMCMKDVYRLLIIHLYSELKWATKSIAARNIQYHATADQNYMTQLNCLASVHLKKIHSEYCHLSVVVLLYGYSLNLSYKLSNKLHRVESKNNVYQWREIKWPITECCQQDSARIANETTEF